MWMSEAEIVTSYREAKSPSQQIKILAQLNDCSACTIKMVLHKHGIVTPQTPKRYGDDRVSADQLRAARTLRKDGISYREIERQTGIPNGLARYYLGKFRKESK